MKDFLKGLLLGCAAFAVVLLVGVAFADPPGTPRGRDTSVNGLSISPASVATGPLMASYVLTNGAYAGFTGTYPVLLSSRSSTTAGIWLGPNAASPNSVNYFVEQESDGSVYTQSNGSAAAFSFGINNAFTMVFDGALTSSAGTFDFKNWKLGGKLAVSGTAPTIASGFGTGASITSSNGTLKWTVDVGTTAGSTGAFTMPNGTGTWKCDCVDYSTTVSSVRTGQSATAANSCTIRNVNLVTGVAANWTDNAILLCSATQG